MTETTVPPPGAPPGPSGCPAGAGGAAGHAVGEEAGETDERSAASGGATNRTATATSGTTGGSDGSGAAGGSGGRTGSSHRAATRRVGALDVVRGIAILGTLASNIAIFTSVGADPETLTRNVGIGAGGSALTVSTFADLLVGVFIDGRFLALLSIVFGIGIAIQFEAAARRQHRWPFRYLWRSFILLVDGFVHYLLVVEFDVLMGYALISALVAPLLLLPRRWFAGAAIALGAVHLAAEAYRVGAPLPFTRRDAGDRDGGGLGGGLSGGLDDDGGGGFERVDRLLASEEPGRLVEQLDGDSYLAEVSMRLESFWESRFEAWVIMPPLTGFLMLVGVALWRAGFFEDTPRAHRMQRRLAVWGLGIGLPLAGLGLLGLVDPENPLSYTVQALGRYTIAPIVAFGYLGLTLVVLRRVGTGWLGRRLAEVGRTALTCYMLQNVIGSVAFHGWGLGLGPLGTGGTIVAWFAISAILCAFAHLWLRRCRSGPFELVWRYLCERPFRGRDRRLAASRSATAPA